jgi:N6-adenosine-specific RNA methylase IME4
MNTKEYDVIVTDPPWAYYGAADKMGAAGKEYGLMTDEDLLGLSYPLSKRGVLFMWATCPRLDFALQCIKAQGLHFRGVAFVWVKTSMAGKPLGAIGVRPSIVKPTTEIVLAASYARKGRPLPLSSESIQQTIFAPRGRHSQKPEEMQDRIEQMYPDLPRAEFFARRHRDGWDCFGGELNNWRA